ncbi:hypothetical protein HanXRQr2_Chr13g0570641 [Helianthus annuus]|nr:hypothetical protein HanXRQr2_Chr13g0570641 [Helianthus annuus]KAJ0847794.1 hypothetical protein HanPSC8_Chr13g0549451 [Helianthus annuus]
MCTAACSSRFNRLRSLVFNTWSLFDGFKEPRDTWNDPIASIDLFGMIKLHLETYIKALSCVLHLLIHLEVHNSLLGGSWSSSTFPSDH